MEEYNSDQEDPEEVVKDAYNSDFDEEYEEGGVKLGKRKKCYY